MPDGAALVTGGSNGIGRAVVETLVAAGERVAFTYRTGERVALQLVEDSSGLARAYPFDLSDPTAPDALVGRVEEQLGPVDRLVNNAGMIRESLLALTSDADWTAVVDVNLSGAFRCCRAVLRGMIHRRSGSIVNVSSLGALHGVGGQAAYAASKAGLLGLTRSLAREVGRKRIRVNAVVPGFVPTEMTRELPAGKITRLRASECLPDGVSARCVAETVAFLLSERASSITGQCFVVDAGASA